MGDSAQASLAKGGFYVFLLKVVSVVMTVATTIILARVLEPEQYGLYTLILTVVCLLVLPSKAGISTLTVREIARQQATKSWGLMKGYLRWSTAVVSLLSLLVMLVSASMLWLWRDSFSSLELSSAAWGLLLIPVMALNSIRSAAMRGLSQAVRGILLEATLLPGIFLMGVLFFLLADLLTASTALGMQWLAMAISVSIGTWWMHRVKPRELFNTKPEYETSRWFKSLLPLTLLAGVQQIIKYTDIVVLGYFTSSADVGIYRIAALSSELVLFTMVTMTMVLSPKIAGLHAAKEQEQLQKLVIFSSRVIFFSSLPVALILIFTGDWLVSLVFGDAYAAGYHALIILSVSQLGVALLGISSVILKMTGHERISVFILAGASITNLALNMALVPIFGIEGAAVATGISLVTAHFFMTVYVKRVHCINLFIQQTTLKR